MNIPTKSVPSYKMVVYWRQNYGSGEQPDQHAVGMFVECETREQVVMLQNELRGISQGNYDDAIFDKLVGANRRMKFKTYGDWAKYMLIWISQYKG